jgi:acyl-coenzyme A synthetase/AMP-(fatty) acid ligase
LIYTGDLPPERFNLSRYCLAEKPAVKTALIVAGETTEQWNYGALEDTVLRMAEGLRHEGLEAGARLLIRMGNSLDYALMFFAANAAGGVPIPASPMLTANEIAYLITDGRPSMLAWDGVLAIPHDGLPKILRPDAIAGLKQSMRGDYADTTKDDPAYLIYTSGTSGNPKGVRHAQRAVWGRRPMYQGWYGIRPDDVMLHTGAFNWTYTMGTGLCDPFANGATAIAYTGPRDNTVWRSLIDTHGATILASVPGLYRQLLRKRFNPGSSLRHGLTAGEPLPLSILDRWRDTTGLELYEALGMSEISTYVSSSPSAQVRRGSPGKPQAGRAVRILDDGQIGISRSDPGLMLGYTSEPDFAGEWFATGDLGRIDGGGYLWHEGRSDDLMNASGYRVSPMEVENILLQHPGVGEAGVAEIRIDETLSIIGAFVVPAEGAAPDEAEILTFVRERLAVYKCPKQVWLKPGLPRNQNGKLIRKQLRP